MLGWVRNAGFRITGKGQSRAAKSSRLFGDAVHGWLIASSLANWCKRRLSQAQRSCCHRGTVGVYRVASSSKWVETRLTVWSSVGKSSH